MIVTTHFDREEFDCRDGTEYPAASVPGTLLLLCKDLEVVREKCGNHPISILSGYRTVSWNKHIGGADDSRHLYGDAADFFVVGVDAKHVFEVCAVLQETGLIHCGGLAYYAQRFPFVHLDIRGIRRRWDGSPDQVPL